MTEFSSKPDQLSRWDSFSHTQWRHKMFSSIISRWNGKVQSNIWLHLEVFIMCDVTLRLCVTLSLLNELYCMYAYRQTGITLIMYWISPCRSERGNKNALLYTSS